MRVGEIVREREKTREGAPSYQMVICLVHCTRFVVQHENINNSSNNALARTKKSHITKLTTPCGPMINYSWRCHCRTAAPVVLG